MIQRFVNDICNILEITSPTISFDTSHFTTATMLAQCDLSCAVIYIRKYNKPNPDQFFSIAHELRHLYQFQVDKTFYFSKYKPAKDCSSIEAYNLQVAEIDANAFAGLIMIEFFHLKPLFQGVSEPVKVKIYEHMNYLSTIL